MKNQTVYVGSRVKVGFDSRIPTRYQGRTAQVAKFMKRGRGRVALVDFGPRRVDFLPVSLTNLTLV